MELAAAVALGGAIALLKPQIGYLNLLHSFFVIGDQRRISCRSLKLIGKSLSPSGCRTGSNTFHSLEDSLDFLENEWPTKFGMHHRRALDLCRAAARRMVVTEAAREAFIAACLEANMPLVLNIGRTAGAYQNSACI